RRRRLSEAVEVPARVDALAAPVGAREQWQRDPREIGGPGPVPLVVERMAFQVLEDVDTVLGQLSIGERDGPRHRLARVRILLRARAEAVRDVDDLVLGPELLELAEDPAVVPGVPIAVVLALPGDDRGQVRRMQAGDAPLVARVVRDAEHADLAVAPRLGARPLDALVEVVDLARAVAVHDTGRPARAARVHADHDIAVRDPALGVGDLPVLILV